MGKVHEKIVNSLMHHKFFAKFPPKAAYTGIFADKAEHLEGLSLEDGAATATAFVAEAICYSICLYLPELPKKSLSAAKAQATRRWFVLFGKGCPIWMLL